MEELQPVDVLAVGAHPDDVELGCSGTLALLAKRNRRVGIVDLTRGELGTRGTPAGRREEALHSAHILGACFRVNLELEDGNLTVDTSNRGRLIQIIRHCRPVLLLTHAGGGHPDHSQARQLVEEGAHHSGLARIDTGQGRFRPEKLAFWTAFNLPVLPQVVADISEVWNDKEASIRAFASQLHDESSGEPPTYLSRPDFLDQVRSYHRHLGNLADCDYGEGFLLSRLPRIADLTAC